MAGVCLVPFCRAVPGKGGWRARSDARNRFSAAHAILVMIYGLDVRVHKVPRYISRAQFGPEGTFYTGRNLIWFNIRWVVFC